MKKTKEQKREDFLSILSIGLTQKKFELIDEEQVELFIEHINKHNTVPEAFIRFFNRGFGSFNSCPNKHAFKNKAPESE